MTDQKKAPERLIVLVDEYSNIVAASQQPMPRSGDAPSEMNIVPLLGQVLHEVAMPEELLGKLENISEFELSVEAGRASLMRRSGEAST